MDQYQALLNSGILYAFKRDKGFRPIFIVNVKAIAKAKLDADTLLKMMSYLFTFLINKTMVPGRVENWNFVFDLKGVGLTEIPKKQLKSMIQPLSNYFKGRLYRMYIVNAQWTIKTLWKLISKTVQPQILQKFKVLGDNFSKDLLEMIDADKLEERFGGTLPNKASDFFPPDLL